MIVDSKFTCIYYDLMSDRQGYSYVVVVLCCRLLMACYYDTVTSYDLPILALNSSAMIIQNCVDKCLIMARKMSRTVAIRCLFINFVFRISNSNFYIHHNLDVGLRVPCKP